MYPKSFTLILLLLATSTALSNNFRTFTSNDGNRIFARLVAYSPEKGVSIIMENGRPFTLPLERFSEKDQKYILEWQQENVDLMTADSEFDVEVLSNRASKRSEDSEGQKQDTEVMTPVVRIKNKEWESNFKGVEGVVALIAENLSDSKNLKVLTVQEFEIDNIPKGKSFEWTGQKVEASYKESNMKKGKGSKDSGFRYKGYLVAIKNRNDDLVYIKGTRSSWEHSFDKVKSLSSGSVYGINLNN